MPTYPSKDKDIRMWCLEYVRLTTNGEAVDEAKKLYQFICPHKAKQLESQMKSPELKSHGFLWRLRCLLKLH